MAAERFESYSMPWFRAVLLIAVIVLTPGYRFRCYWACKDQTGIQNDYVEQRDRCREYAQLKLDMAMRSVPQPHTDSTSKSQLVTLFSECMANNGWTVPSGREENNAAGISAGRLGGYGSLAPPTVAAGAVAGAAAANPQSLGGQAPAPPPPAAQQDNRAFLSRTSECAFARHSASVSRIAAVRARACDIECDERLRAAPEGPRPAACPAEASPEFATGVDRGDQ